MTAAAPRGSWEAAPADRGVWAARLAFAASSLIILTFSQGWFMLIAGPEEADTSESGLIRAVFLPAYAAALALAAARPATTLRAMLYSAPVWALMALTFVSMLWSIDPATTERRAFAVTLTALGGLVIASRYDWEDLTETLAASFLGLAVASLLLGLLVPRYGRMTDIFPGAWRGVWQEKNLLGNVMTLGFIALAAAAILNPRHRRRWAAGAALAVVLILLSGSKTALVSLLLGMASLAFVGVVRRGGPVAAVLATLAALTVAGGLVTAIVLAPDLFLGLLGKDSTLTGRAQIWDAINRLIAQRPMTGYGYAAIWTNEDPWSPLARIIKEAKFRPHHAHNSWLEARLGLGYVGLTVWSVLFAQTWLLTIWAAYRSRGGYLALPFMIVFSLQTLSESIAFNYNELMWLVFVVVAVRVALPSKAPEFGRGLTLSPAVRPRLR